MTVSEIEFCEKLFDIDDTLKQLQTEVNYLTDVEVEHFNIEAEFEFTTISLQTIRGWIKQTLDSYDKGNVSNDVSKTQEDKNSTHEGSKSPSIKVDLENG